MRFVGEDIGILSRIGSAFSYLTGGWGGLIIFVILYFIKKRASHFFTFNVYQSIIISFTLFVIGMGWSILFDIFTKIPLIRVVVSWMDFIFNRAILFSRSVTELIIAILVLYCTILCLCGKYPKIYKISDLIDRTH